MKTLHLTNYWHGTSGALRVSIPPYWMRRTGTAGDAAGGSSDETRVQEVGKFGRIYHVAAPHAPLNSRYRVLYPTQFLRAGSPLQRILEQERPDLVEICDKYSLNYLGTVLRLGLLKAGFQARRSGPKLRAHGRQLRYLRDRRGWDGRSLRSTCVGSTFRFSITTSRTPVIPRRN